MEVKTLTVKFTVKRNFVPAFLLLAKNLNREQTSDDCFMTKSIDCTSHLVVGQFASSFIHTVSFILPSNGCDFV